MKTNYVVRGKELEQVSDFSYFGLVVNEYRRLDRELGRRTCKRRKVGGQLYKTIFNKKEVGRITRLCLCSCNAVF